MDAATGQRILDSSAQVFMAKGRLAAAYYRHMFALAPESEALFTSGMHRRNAAFTAALATMIGTIGDRVRFDRVLRQLGHRHVRAGIGPAQFALGARAFDLAIADVLGPACTEELRAAWNALYAEMTTAMLAARAEGPDGPRAG